MSDAKASEAARELVRHRWGARVPVRAAAVVVDRVSELGDDELAEVAEAAAAETERRQVAS